MKIKRRIAVVIAVLMVAGLALFAGCGKSTKSSTVNSATLGVPIYPGAKKDNTNTSTMSLPNGSAPSPTDSRPQPQGMQGSMPQGSAPQPGNNGPNGYNQGAPPGGTMPGTLAAYTTQDSTDKVISWYRDKLKGMSDFKEMTPSAGSSAPSGQSANTAIFSVTSNGQGRTMMIRPASTGNSGTVIVISEMQGTSQQSPAQNSGTY